MNNPADHWPRGWPERGSDLKRTASFNDAVFAIAITLLVLEIHVPEIPAGSVATVLPSALVELWPKFSSFLLSFWLVSLYWLAHHRTFHYISGYDRRLLLINLLFLMWIVLLPFSASLLGEYGNQQIVVLIYAVHLALTGLTLSWLWWHAWRRNPDLLDTAGVDPREFRYNELRLIIPPLIFVLSIGVSFLSIGAAPVMWLLTLVTGPVLLRIFGRPAA
jgi:uncharacterized membrane protein